MAVPFAYELIATMLLTGGRPSEVTALTVGDVNLSRDLVTIRGTKTANAVRVVPLWPQLAAILGRTSQGSPRKRCSSRRPRIPGGRSKDLRKMLDGIVDSTGVWKAGEIHPYIFRHAYCAARLQTLDGGCRSRPTRSARRWGTVATPWSGACMVIWARCGIGARPWSSAWSSIALLYGGISAACSGAGCHSNVNRKSNSKTGGSRNPLCCNTGL